MAAGATMTASTGRAVRVAWLEPELERAAATVKLDGGKLVSMARLDGSVVGISIASV
jgi:adenylosuccinate synthase